MSESFIHKPIDTLPSTLSISESSKHFFYKCENQSVYLPGGSYQIIPPGYTDFYNMVKANNGNSSTVLGGSAVISIKSINITNVPNQTYRDYCKPYPFFQTTQSKYIYTYYNGVVDIINVPYIYSFATTKSLALFAFISLINKGDSTNITMTYDASVCVVVN